MVDVGGICTAATAFVRGCDFFGPSIDNYSPPDASPRSQCAPGSQPRAREIHSSLPPSHAAARWTGVGKVLVLYKYELFQIDYVVKVPSLVVLRTAQGGR
jgi:hypothetical protein